MITEVCQRWRARCPTMLDGAAVQPWGSDALVREHIGNGVPVGAAQRIAEQMLFTLGGSDIGVGLFASGGEGVWVHERQIAGLAERAGITVQREVWRG